MSHFKKTKVQVMSQTYKIKSSRRANKLLEKLKDNMYSPEGVKINQQIYLNML